jgi:NAD(P)-dependent dehydrogenase (short-subunit alcohol dehydrogenase family)
VIYTIALMAPVDNDSLGLADPNRLFEVHGKTVVITGGARGLGLHFGQCLARFGANIAAIDIASQPSDAFLALSQQGGNHRYYQADVIDYDGLKATIDHIVRDFGSIEGWY